MMLMTATTADETPSLDFSHRLQFSETRTELCELFVNIASWPSALNISDCQSLLYVSLLLFTPEDRKTTLLHINQINRTIAKVVKMTGNTKDQMIYLKNLFCRKLKKTKTV